MPQKNKFLFNENLQYKSEPDFKIYDIRLSNLISEAVSLNLSFFLVDHYSKNIKLAHFNPQIKCLGNFGVQSINETQLLELFDPDFSGKVPAYFKILNYILRTMKDHECKQLSFVTSIISNQIKDFIEFKFIPYVYHEKDYDTLWLTFCLLHPVKDKIHGKFVITDIEKSNKVLIILKNTELINCNSFCLLTQEEYNIINYSAEGLHEKEIAREMNILYTELKNIKYRLFLKMNVKSMVHAISILKKQGF